MTSIDSFTRVVKGGETLAETVSSEVSCRDLWAMVAVLSGAVSLNPIPTRREGCLEACEMAYEIADIAIRVRRGEF